MSIIHLVYYDCLNIGTIEKLTAACDYIQMTQMKEERQIQTYLLHESVQGNDEFE